MKRIKAKYFITGLIIGALVFSSAAVAFAKLGTETLKAYYRNIKVYIDNHEINYFASNGSYSEPFIVNGTTYVPLRLFSEKMGCSVDWDEKTNSIYISKDGSGNNTDPGQQNDGIYYLGDEWKAPGNWSLTIDSVRTTNERNEYYERNNEIRQVIIVKYHYTNIGYKNYYTGEESLIMDLDLAESVVDCGNNVVSSYPIYTGKSAKYTPIAATCEAEAAFGLKTPGSPVTINVKEYDKDGNPQYAKFLLKV